MSKTVKDLETYATLLQSSIYDLYKAQKINDPLKKFCLYGVRKNSIKTNQQSILFGFVSQVQQNNHSIYPHLIELIQSSSTYYLCFDSFNLMLDVTLSKGYKDNYLYNITKRKQHIDDMRKIAETCDRQLAPVNLVMDDQHVYCLPPYNSPKGNYQQANKTLMIKLIYSLVTGEKLLDDKTKISENGKNLVKLLETNYSNPHLYSIIHDNLQRDDEEIEFNNLGVNNNLKNLAKDLDFRRSQNIVSNTKSAGYDMNFDEWTPDMLLDDEKIYKPVISGRVSTILEDQDYPSIDDYKPYARDTNQNGNQYPGFVSKSEEKKTEGYKPNYPQFANKQSNTNAYRYQNKYPNINPSIQPTNTAAHIQSQYPTDFGQMFGNSNKQKTNPQTNQHQKNLSTLHNKPEQAPNNTHIPSQYPQLQQTKLDQNQYSLYPQPKEQKSINNHNLHSPKQQQAQLPQQTNHVDLNRLPSPTVKIPSIQTNPHIPSPQKQQQLIPKPYIPSRPPIENRLTKNGKKDEINHILSSITGFLSTVKPQSTAGIKKPETLKSLFKPENDSPDKLFEFALQNYLGQFKLYSRLIKSFLTYYLTSNLGRVASFLLARSCVHRKLRLINELISGKDVFDLGSKVMKNVDVSKYVERVQKTVYKEDPEQFKLLINFKLITPETYTILKPYLGEIDETDKTETLCFFYLYTLSLRDPKKDLHHLLLYDALYVLHYKGYEFLYDYKQIPKEYNEEYVQEKKAMIQLLAIR